MRYHQKEERLEISAAEMVERAAIAHLPLTAEDEGGISLCPPRHPEGEAVSAMTDMALGDVLCRVTAEAFRLADGSLRLYLLTDEDPLRLSAGLQRVARGYGFAAAYVLGGGESCSVSVCIRSDLYGREITLCERPTASALARFFEKLVNALLKDADKELERVVKRMPTMAALKFPYGVARDGQKEMMNAVYTAARRGETLLATAPTGTGKTMAALYPAVRAIGVGAISRVFYLTPKTTSARVAEQAVRDMAAAGADVRGILLHAKERICEGRRTRGHCSGCPRRRGRRQAEEKACLELLQSGEVVVTEQRLIETAKKHDVCPHELALIYSLYADVIIGDYNYLFDPRVFLRRFFEHEGEYLVLLDEAHNLPDRAREMYSSELTAETLTALRGLFSDSARLQERIDALRAAFTKQVDTMLSGELREDENGTVVGFATDAAFPTELAGVLSDTVECLLPEVRVRGPESEADRLRREAVYALSGVYETICRMDDHFTVYALREGEERRLSFFCIDPSRLICERLDRCRAAVFFSATLSPLAYYRSVLCGDRPVRQLAVPSPFSEYSLCVGIMDKLSVRAVAREETMPELARVVATVMKARQGNYMVFCPSFSYMEQLADAFHRLAPRAAYVVQKRQMTSAERAEFLAKFAPRQKGYFVGFCVTGGIYSEGIDLTGNRLIGAIVIGVGLPGVSAERELIARYYQEKCEEGKEFAYLYPGMNRVLQAAGRVIRKETDRGVIVLIDDRLRDPACIKIFPDSWRHLKYVGDRRALTTLLTRFWDRVDEEEESAPTEEM